MSTPPEVGLNDSVNDFLDRLASRTPTPGGGSVASLAGALSCAMGRMVAAYSNHSGEQATALGAKLDKADSLLRALVAEDMTAYETLSRVSREAREDPESAGLKEHALVTAALVPLEMAAAAVGALAVMDELRSAASKYLLSDLGVAAVMGLACARAAAYSVRVNVVSITDSEKRRELMAEINRLTADAERHAAAVEEFVGQSLQIEGD